MTFPYDDILDHPRYTPKNREPLPMKSRAAQFSPFAALTGYDDAIAEAHRLTEEKRPLTSEEETILNMKHKILVKHLKDHPILSISHFVPDERKSGGRYETKTGPVVAINEFMGWLRFADGTKIFFTNLFSMEGKLFDDLDFLL